MAETRNDTYANLSREELIERLAQAEDVCVLVGWTAVRHGSDRDDALTELWMKWANTGGASAHSREGNPHLADEELQEIAKKRRQTREWSLARLNSGGQR